MVNYKLLEYIQTNRFVAIDGNTGYDTVLHYIISQMTFHDNYKVLMLGDRKKHLETAKKVYEAIPPTMKPVADKIGESHFHLKNNSAIMACGYKSEAMRGCAFRLVVMDDYAAQSKVAIDHVWENMYLAGWVSGDHTPIVSCKDTQIVILAGETPFDLIMKDETYRLF